MSEIDDKRLRDGDTGNRFTYVMLSPHITEVTSREDGTTIRWSFDRAMTDKLVGRSVERDYERINRRMAKARGKKLPKTKKGDLVHHENEDYHASHLVGECPYESSPCYAEKIHAKCKGDKCKWFDTKNYAIDKRGSQAQRTKKTKKVSNPPHYMKPKD